MSLNLFGYEIRSPIKKSDKDEGGYQEPQSTIYADIQSLVDSLWKVTDDRRAIELDIDRMTGGDELVAEAIDILKTDCFAIKNFYADILAIEAKDENLKNRIEDIIARSGLLDYIDNVFYDIIKYSNVFAEFLIDSNAKFYKLHFIPQSWSMYRNVDKHGQLLKGDPALGRINVAPFDQRSDSGNFLAAWEKWQIIQWRGAPFDKEGYGIPFLKAARRNWLRLYFLEDSMAVARLMRAYMKEIHQVPVPEEADYKAIKRAIREYKKSQLKLTIASASNSLLKRSHVVYPNDVATNYYLPTNSTMKGSVTTLDPSNQQLQNLRDMEYFENKLFARLKVPKSRLGHERDINAKATLVEQNTAYASTITGFQIVFLRGVIHFVKQALYLEGGISDVNKLEFKLILPSPFVKNELDRARVDQLDASTADKLVDSGVWSRRTARIETRDMSVAQSDEEQDQIEAEKESGIYPEKKAGIGLAASASPLEKDIIQTIDRIKEKINGDGDRNSHSPSRITH